MQWASSMESKRYPIVVFNPRTLTDTAEHGAQRPVGARHHLTYKLSNCEARIVANIFQANGFTEVGAANQVLVTQFVSRDSQSIIPPQH